MFGGESRRQTRPFGSGFLVGVGIAPGLTMHTILNESNVLIVPCRRPTSVSVAPSLSQNGTIAAILEGGWSRFLSMTSVIHQGKWRSGAIYFPLACLLDPPSHPVPTNLWYQRMSNSKRLAAVRAHFRDWLAEHATSADGRPKIASESLLVRNGFYRGRSFDAGSHRAVWFIEEDQLKIHGPEGDVVASFAGDQISSITPADVIQLPTQQAETDADTSTDESRRAA